MPVLQVGRRWRSARLVVPLALVVVSALFWSGFATFRYVEGPVVPGWVAWTLIAALDGTVVVTTPVWLSTVLPPSVRNYAATICVGALVGSMVINYSETGWPGVFPPLIAGLLLHLVGVVLRAFARMDVENVVVSETVLVEMVTPEAVVVSCETEDVRPKPVLKSVPVDLSLISVAGSAAEVAKAMLCEAHARAAELPGGAEITAACRAAGFEVNDNYGRSFKSRWSAQNSDVHESVTG